MSQILLIRHGESTWNASGRWQGHADAPLSVRGRSEANAAGAQLVDTFDHAWSSDLQRANDTARSLARSIGLSVVHVDPDLRERAAGPWEGLTRDDIETGWPNFLSTGDRPDGYESDDLVIARVVPSLAKIASAAPRSLVVTHGGVMRALERHLTGSDRRVANLGGWWLHAKDGHFRIGDTVQLTTDTETSVIE